MKLSHQLLLLPRLYNNTLTDVLSQQKRRHFSLCRGLYDFWENVIADIISVARNNGVLSIKDHIHMLQHFLLMYVLETHERRKVISATVWNRSESEPFLFWSCLRHIICFSCELDCIHFHRGFISDDMLRMCVDRIGGCCSAWGPLSMAIPSLSASKPRRKTFSPPPLFFFCFMALNCTCLMSWHLFFQFTPPPLHFGFPSFLHSLFLFLFFFFIQSSSCWHS